jgi:hypothetical protein
VLIISLTKNASGAGQAYFYYCGAGSFAVSPNSAVFQMLNAKKPCMLVPPTVSKQDILHFFFAVLSPQKVKSQGLHFWY